MRPTESDDEDEDVDELATPAPQVASTANGHRDVDMQAGDDDDDEDGVQRSDDDSSGDEQDEDNVRAKALSNKDQQKGVRALAFFRLFRHGLALLTCFITYEQ